MKRLLLPVLLIGLIVAAALPAAATRAATLPSARLTLSSGALTEGQYLYVTVTGRHLADVYAYEAQLAYDTGRLRFKSAYSEMGEGFSVEPKAQQGVVRFAYTRIGTGTGQSGDFALCTFVFESIAAGEAALSLESVKLVSSVLTATLLENAAAAKATVTSAAGTGAGGVGSGQAEVPILEPVVSYGDTVSAVITREQWLESVSRLPAHRDKRRAVRVNLAVGGGAPVSLQFPAEAISHSDNVVQLEIKTPHGLVTLPGNMLANIEPLPTGTAELRIEPANAGSVQSADDREEFGNRPMIAISLLVDGQPIKWSNYDAAVTIAIPYRPTTAEALHPEFLVIRYVDEHGRIVAVPNGNFDSQRQEMVFDVPHFSIYAVAYAPRLFADLNGWEWARPTVEALAAKGIVNGYAANAFRPGKQVSRAEFIVLLMRTLELSGEDRNGAGAKSMFADVPNGAYYGAALHIAYKLGIVNGIGDGMFRPNKAITREEMMALTHRALAAARQPRTPVVESDAGTVLEPRDAEDIALYAREAVGQLLRLGLAQGYDGRIHPKLTATRAEAATIIHNLYAYLYGT